MTMAKVQTWTPLENNTMWQQFGPPVVCFHPLTNPFKHKLKILQYQYKFWHLNMKNQALITLVVACLFVNVIIMPLHNVGWDQN
jgi:hypothetical protein